MSDEVKLTLKRRVRKLYLAGLSAPQIAIELEMVQSWSTINRWMRDEGISRKSGGSKSKWPESVHQEAVRLYKTGMIAKEISKQLNNIKPMTIRSWITKSGITKRPMGWHFIGKRNCNWKGGVQGVDDKGSEQYRRWRLQVLKRDNFMCVCCKKVGGYLEAHHILGFVPFPQHRFTVENGVALCQDCHYKVHGRNRRKCING